MKNSKSSSSSASSSSVKLTVEQEAKIAKAIERYGKRKAYHAKRNLRPDVIAKRREYNSRRWQEEKELLALARSAGKKIA